MSWKRPNIGSRVSREVHARFWERAEVKVLRATRHSRRFGFVPFRGVADMNSSGEVAKGHKPTLRNGVELHLEGGGAHSDRNHDIESTATSASGDLIAVPGWLVATIVAL